jgi:dienelactone hydrolase
MRRIVCLIVVAAAALGACSSSGSKPSASSGGPTSSTVAPAIAAKAYEAAGPHPVGVTTYTLPTGNQVEVWYPAVDGTTGTISYDVRDYVPAAIKKLLTANVPATFSYPGRRDAAVAPGPFPLVLFSHGFSGIRMQSSFLTSHLASWGMIVAAPEHPSRDLTHALVGDLGPAQASVNDIKATLQLVTNENTKTGSLLDGHVDLAHVAAVGHSAGGATALSAAEQMPQVAGYVSLASGIFKDSRSSTTAGATTTTVAMPAKPSLFVAGMDDHVAVFAQVTKPAFDAAAAPTRLWYIDKLGHNGFDDFCTFGNGKGIIGVAEAAGLGPALSKPPLSQFKALGEDGCSPPALPVRQVWPIIDHVVTSWLRTLFGTDKTPVGLDASVAGEYNVKVDISARLG